MVSFTVNEIVKFKYEFLISTRHATQILGDELLGAIGIVNLSNS